MSLLPRRSAPSALAARESWTSGLLERERELEALTALLQSARAGRGGVVLLQGAAGLGKSRLLRWSRERAAQDGMLTLHARASETERDLSFGVVLQLLDMVLSDVDATARRELLSGPAALALPLLEGPGGPGARREHHHLESLLHGLFWLVANLSSSSPVLIAVDDVNCSDPISLRFLLYLVRRIEGLPVALVLARRPLAPDTHELVEEIAGDELTRRIDLAPLTLAGVTELLAEHLDQQADPDFVAACRHATGGNPFLLRALVGALAQDEIEPTRASVTRIARLRPEDVGQQLMVRVARLGSDAIALAWATAVMGDGTPLVNAAVLAGLGLERAAHAADLLAAADVFSSAAPVAFTHPLQRSALYEELPPARRAHMHLRAARLLRKERAPTEVIAAQLLPAMRSGEPWALATLRDAATAASSSGNPESAMRYLTRALREAPADGERAELLVELARAEALLAEPGAETHLRESLSLTVDARLRAQALQVLGRVLYTQGKPAEAAEAFETALSLLADPTDPLARDLHVGYFSAATLEPALNEKAFAHIEPLLRRPSGGKSADERVALAATVVHGTWTMRPDVDAVALAQRAWGHGVLLDDEGPDGWAWSFVAAALAWNDEFYGAISVCEAVIQRARACGSLMAYATASFCAQLPNLLLGRLAEARAHGEAALGAQRLGWRTFATTLAGTHARVLIEQDELEAAEALLEAGIGDPVAPKGQLPAAYVARGKLRLLQDRNEEALADFLMAGELFSAIGGMNPTIVPWRAGAARAAARLGRPDQARTYAEEAWQVAQQRGVASHLSRALRVRASLTGPEHAADLLEQALEALASSNGGLERARCHAQLGALLRRAGERTRAIEHLRQAAEQASHAGMRLLEREVQAELRVAGARPRRLQFSGLDALTASERRIVEMAAEGLSNREIAQALFLTTRTIEQHLYNAYKKLGVSSRRRLAEVLRPGSKVVADDALEDSEQPG